MRHIIIRAAAVTMLAAPVAAGAQARTFIVTLGNDTVAVERVVRSGDKIEGTLVRHLPATSMLKYSLVLNRDGTVASYEQGSYRADGTPMPPNAQTGAAVVGLKMTFIGDSVFRQGVVNDQPVVRRTAVPKGTIPAIGGGSWFGNELMVDAARKHGKVDVISFAPNANAAISPDIRILSPDSGEIVVQGFRTGVKTDRHGQLVHGDASLTTNKYDVRVVKDADVAAIARNWAATEAAGAAVTPTNIPDSIMTTIGDAHVEIRYSRPARRGREIWGKLVPFDTVWRLGADYATQLKTDKPILLGGKRIEPGTYTLWLLPSQGETYLIVNTKITDPRDPTRRLWGTQWDPTNDIAKIPVQKHPSLPMEEERFHMFIENGMLMMHWGNSGYGISIKGA